MRRCVLNPGPDRGRRTATICQQTQSCRKPWYLGGSGSPRHGGPTGRALSGKRRTRVRGGLQASSGKRIPGGVSVDEQQSRKRGGEEQCRLSRRSPKITPPLDATGTSNRHRGKASPVPSLALPRGLWCAHPASKGRPDDDSRTAAVSPRLLDLVLDLVSLVAALRSAALLHRRSVLALWAFRQPQTFSRLLTVRIIVATYLLSTPLNPSHSAEASILDSSDSRRAPPPASRDTALSTACCSLTRAGPCSVSQSFQSSDDDPALLPNSD